jgi:peroxiredoxin
MIRPIVSLIRSLLFLFVLHGTVCSAQAMSDGYNIRVEVSNATDTELQLCHYYGKPSKVNIDTIIQTKPGQKLIFHFRSTKKITGGLYVLKFKNTNTQLDFILNNGDNLNITFDYKNPIESAGISGSQLCLDYLAYQRFVLPYNQKFAKLEEDRKKIRNKQDSIDVATRRKQYFKETEDYRQAFIKKNPEHLMSKMFKAASYTEMPESIQKDKEKSNAFIRQHIWDGFDFNEERLAMTPFVEAKLGAYLSSVPQIADTINAVTDDLLKRMSNAKELYKLTVDWLVKTQENVKATFGDDCFIYVVEKYYLNNHADWINDSTRNSYLKKLSLLSRNVIGVRAPDFELSNLQDMKVTLQSIYPKHSYTLLMFWSPTCNHCTDELPKLDSAVASLKKDIQLVGIDAHREGPAWKKWIGDHKLLANWIHLYDANKSSNIVSDYSVYTTPVLYLLDRKGKIVGKRITHQNVKEILADLEKR